ncbi:copper homeostasis protein CutC [Deinococcus roseus]|uniref:Copper homeostasis protein cutC homolog n=1 Tax=Deinococcus roseus TaxID=392414 RepID=A0ABQ2CU28_9DEIO|nr:copper homeostasis protein CutC [Deinococcus roseus]GGJ20415.1 copper homeostasis protein CutC [Deinococcus roseus]
MIAEVIVENATEVRTAQNAGANRLLLARHIMQGGVSPDLKTIAEVLEASRVPVYALVRPDLKDYAYGLDRKPRIYKILDAYRRAGIQNISFGAIEGSMINWLLLEEAITYGFNITFNAAFDFTQELSVNYLLLSMYPRVERVTTRGQAVNIPDGQAEVKKLVSLNKPHLRVMVEASGFTYENLPAFLQETGVKEIQFGRTVRDEHGKLNPITLAQYVSIMNGKPIQKEKRGLHSGFDISSDVSRYRR